MTEPQAPTPLIDVPEVLADLQAIVAEAGDGHRCRTFRYKEGDGQPSCLVGHVLDRHRLLSQVRSQGPFFSAVLAHARFTPAALRVLGRVQDVQDKGHTWGDALIAAKEAAEECAS